MKKIYVTGISGTGKTTIAHELNKKGIKAFSIDEVPGLCFWINKASGIKVDYEAKLDQTFIDTHVWMCDVEHLKSLLSINENVIVLGHAENENDFLNLFDQIILLQCKPETFIRRILEREDNVFGKDETAQKYLLNTYKDFEEGMIKRGAVSVHTDEALDKVIDKIAGFL
jgi:broad-specificity NMP kinase